MHNVLPEYIETALALAHPTWHAHLREGLDAMMSARPDYFSTLADTHIPFYPTEHRLFAAFAQSKSRVSHVLMGEGPYPRAESATGFCFIDGAVKSLWQPDAGLSKQVNRATSLRNFIKMLLVADNVIRAEQSTSQAIRPVAETACAPGSTWIQTAGELQDNLLKHGFLLLNASLLFRRNVAPIVDAKAWTPFLRCVLKALSSQVCPKGEPVKLILWGKIAEKIISLPETAGFAKLVAEHPYNLSFINNQEMQNLFRPLQLLKSNGADVAKKLRF